ncbi:MAG: response regulator transcription factor [Elusimicrobiota bacterium]
MYNKIERIFLVQKGGMLSSMLVNLLEKEKYAVKVFERGDEALTEIKYFPPDMLILDLDLPDEMGDISGWELLRIIRNTPVVSGLPIIIISEKYTQPIHTVRALSEFCADDFVNKPYSENVLIARIKALIRRKSNIISEKRQEIIRCGDLRIFVQRMVVFLNGSQVHLTKTEFNVLLELAQNRETPVLRAELYKKVLGHIDPQINSRTIDKHIEAIRKKLKGYSKNVITVPGVGYKFSMK